MLEVGRANDHDNSIEKTLIEKKKKILKKYKDGSNN